MPERRGRVSEARAGLAAALAAAFGLVGHPRLTRPFRLALVVWAGALAVVAVLPRVPVAAAALVVLGGCSALVDVCALNVLQRIVPERLLGRVLGVVEGTWWAMFGLGSLAAAPLVEALGVRPAVAVTGGFLAAAVLLLGAGLGAVDARARAPQAQLAAIRGVPFFAGQPPLALERLALELVPVTVGAGAAVVTCGEAGDRFYIVEKGTVQVVRADADSDVELGPGDWFAARSPSSPTPLGRRRCGRCRPPASSPWTATTSSAPSPLTPTTPRRPSSARAVPGLSARGEASMEDDPLRVDPETMRRV